MKRYQFSCTFLEDVVLNARTATEGNSRCLDFIPGSNFLGIVAKNYDEFQNEGIAYSIFHSGKIRFGDAHLYQNGERSIKMPASWYHAKGTTLTENTGNIWVHGFIPETELDRLQQDSIQLKQIRSGYFLVKSGLVVDAKKEFSLKSAWDRERRKTKKENLYGYTALKRGSVWSFFLECDDNEVGNRVVEILEGNHHIGRSRTAQYGTVKIELLAEHNVADHSEPTMSGEILLYAESRLILFDEYGRPTTVPTAANLGLPDGSIVIKAKSQIRSYTYAPWNFKRQCRDADRICIEKGSVIAVLLNKALPTDYFVSGVGSYRSEGFGKLLVNPSFLKADTSGILSGLNLRIPVEETEKTVISINDSHNDTDTLLINWLQAREDAEVTEEEILHKVNKYVKEKGCMYNKKGKVTPSQWGQIRTLAASKGTIEELTDALYRQSVTDSDGKVRSAGRHRAGFLVEGKSSEIWRKRIDGKELSTHLRNVIEEEASKYGPVFVVHLASAMRADAKRRGAIS